MDIRSERDSTGAATPVGVLHAASRWVVEHKGLATLLTVLLAAALCICQWWLAYRQAQDWDIGHHGQPVPFRLFAPAGWALMIGMGSWLGLWTLSRKEDASPAASSAADGWRFGRRQRQRIFEGRPISRRFLWSHGLFGLLGFALALALELRLAAAAGWQEQLLSPDGGPIYLVGIAILMMAFAAQRIRDVLFLQHCDCFVGDRALELARAVAAEQQAEAEAEREYERKTITGWAYVVLMGGLGCGLFLTHRWLPDADGTTAFQASVSGVIGGVAAVYLLKTKPRAWQLWLGVALAVAAGFLVFTHESWHRSPLYLLLGTLWGIGIGVAATLLYLRDLRRR